MPKALALLSGVFGGFAANAMANVFCAVGLTVCTPAPALAQLVQPLHCAVTCQCVALTCVPADRTV